MRSQTTINLGDTKEAERTYVRLRDDVLRVKDDLASVRRDLTDYIFDATSLGPELIVNGGFDTDSDWVKDVGWSITNGKANCTINADIPVMLQTIPAMVVGETYRVSYTVSDVNLTTGDYIYAGMSGVGPVQGQCVTSNGTYADNLLCRSNKILLFKDNTGDNGSYKIDNVSVKQVLSLSLIAGDNFVAKDGVLFESVDVLPAVVDGKVVRLTTDDCLYIGMVS